MEINTTVLAIKPDDKNIFTLSVSKAKTFDDCKAKYMYQYIQRLPQKEWEHLTFGKFLHEILETYHAQLILDPTKNKGSLMTECFSNAVKNYEVSKEQKDEAQSIIKSYLSKKEVDISVLSVEKKFYIDINGKVLLNGFIDRVQKDPDGVIHVADYKTTKQKKYLNDFFQLLTYAFVLMTEDLSIDKIRASYILLRHDFEYMTKEFSREDVMTVAPKYLEYAKKIEEEQLWRPSPTFLCKFCSFVDECKSGKDFLIKRGLIKTAAFGLSEW